MSKDVEFVRLSGKAFWSKLFRANEQGDFTVELSVDENTKEKLLQLGATVKNATEWNEENRALINKGKRKERDESIGDYVTLKSKFAPQVFDKTAQPWDNQKQIGNGSTVNVVVVPYEWKKDNKKGIGLGLRKLQVAELVEYSKPSSQSFDNLDSSESPF